MIIRDVLMSNKLLKKNIKLKIKHVSYNSKSKNILNGISFSSEKGNIAVIGPNGAGKTTLLKIIAGLIAPSAGEVYIDDAPVSKMSPVNRAAKIAVVNQINHVNKQVTLGQYVRLGRLPFEKHESNSKSSEITEKAMEMTGVENIQERPFGLLSGGERQRAHIARAICQTPDILILDEPTNHLDPEAKESILSMLIDSDMRIIASLHDIGLASGFAENTLILKDGALSAFGNSTEVIKPEIIQSVFKAEMLTIKHPTEDRFIQHLDVKINRKSDIRKGEI